MKIPISVYGLLCTGIFFIYSCTNANKETVSPSVCKADSPVSMSYSKDIRPIFSSYCYGCHSTENQGVSGVDLEDTTQLNKYIQNDQLVNNINHAAGADPMPPPPAQKLSDCNISEIELWISQGAPKNN